MSKLHELLAARESTRSQAETCRADLINTFNKKGNHFAEKRVTFRSSEEGKEPVVEEQLGLQTTVTKELGWIGEKISSAINISYEIDVANASAKANVELEDGTVLLSDVPTTALLELEKRMKEIHDLVAAIPTLDPSKGFEADTQRGDGIFKARDNEKHRTEKQFDFKVMVPATDKHPAQVKELMLDKKIGTLLTQEWSGLITVAAKGDMLDRIENLTRAVKKARSRANDTEVRAKTDRQDIGKRIWDFVTTAKS